jgi:formamidopyrimidine-DNA glycosylase
VPELPDVEQFRRFFRVHATGRTVATVVADPTILRNTTSRTLGAALRARTFLEPARHGKWLIGWTDGPALLLHFGMTGDLVWSGDEPARHWHDRLVLAFRGGGELRYRNMRKLGGAWLAHDESEVGRILGALGPDALGLGRRAFLERVGTRRGQVKAALMDQSFVAGVGNLIADEVLWQARLHPKRRIESLSADERATLFGRLRSVLREAVDRYDDVGRKRPWLSHVRGRPGAVCPRCGTPLARTVAAGRTTYFCPRCQPETPPGSAGP